MFRALGSLSLLFTLACTPKTEPDDSATTEDSATTDDSTGTDDSAGGDTAVDPATRYATHCANCHGASAEGGSAPGLERELGHTDEQLVRVILEGKEDMPAIEVTEEQAYAIITWLRELFAR